MQLEDKSAIVAGADVALFFAAFPSTALTASRWSSATGGSCSNDGDRQ